jgi:hypothetical protein
VNYYLPRKNVTVYVLGGTYSQSGVPELTNYPLGSSNSYLMYGNDVEIKLQNIPGAVYTWSVPAGYTTPFGFNPAATGYSQIIAPVASNYQINVSLAVSGYSTQYASYYFYPTGDGIGCVASYNDNTGNVEISFTDVKNVKASSYSIKIMDIYGSVAGQTRSSGEQVSINLSPARSGFYIVNVYGADSNLVYSTKIKKQ